MSRVTNFLLGLKPAELAEAMTMAAEVLDQQGREIKSLQDDWAREREECAKWQNEATRLRRRLEDTLQRGPHDKNV